MVKKELGDHLQSRPLTSQQPITNTLFGLNSNNVQSKSPNIFQNLLDFANHPSTHPHSQSDKKRSFGPPNIFVQILDLGNRVSSMSSHSFTPLESQPPVKLSLDTSLSQEPRRKPVPLPSSKARISKTSDPLPETCAEENTSNPNPLASLSLPAATSDHDSLNCSGAPPLQQLFPSASAADSKSDLLGKEVLSLLCKEIVKIMASAPPMHEGWFDRCSSCNSPIRVDGKNLFKGNDYLRSKVLVDDDIVKEVSGLDLIDLEFGFFLAKFAEEDMLRIVSNGPYIVGGQPLYIQKWKLGFQPSSARIFSMVTWVRFIEFPMEFHYDEFLFANTSAVGMPIKVNRQTSMATRECFVRVCIGVNLEQPLVLKEKTVSLQEEDRVVNKVDKGSVEPGKRIFSGNGPVGPRGKGKKPMVVKGVVRSGNEKGQF
ncbi:hypothetical protein K2173_003516 [Erythroxylum novogranatense]|uniref:DUF4283 domain-containing protein n=1 Tax=Erythroxylum novogranatense TaxID=1862640 RepID=A0AAV8TBR0_9ROSI|nr:hypothetical protein K2173_003516 [Erythroxylum novogranatense]